jgi:hypothetical protein
MTQTAWGYKVSNNACPGFKKGSVFWYDTTIETTEPNTYVLLVPVAASDSRRYIRLLKGVTDTAFVVAPAVDFEFCADQWFAYAMRALERG